jgi:hypothetical protein
VSASSAFSFVTGHYADPAKPLEAAPSPPAPATADSLPASTVEVGVAFLSDTLPSPPVTHTRADPLTQNERLGESIADSQLSPALHDAAEPGFAFLAGSPLTADVPPTEHPQPSERAEPGQHVVAVPPTAAPALVDPAPVTSILSADQAFALLTEDTSAMLLTPAATLAQPDGEAGSTFVSDPSPPLDPVTESASESAFPFVSSPHAAPQDAAAPASPEGDGSLCSLLGGEEEEEGVAAVLVPSRCAAELECAALQAELDAAAAAPQSPSIPVGDAFSGMTFHTDIEEPPAFDFI